MTRVVIVGAGFGGLQCAKVLAHRPVDVLLVDRNDYHLFTPLLYQVASSLLNPSDIAYPVRTVFRRASNIEFRMATVVRLDCDAKRIVLEDGSAEPYDVLVLATGAQPNFFGQADVARTAYHLNELPRAMELRNHILMCFERAVATSDPAERASWMRFVIVGGGPTGVEYAGALAELVRLMLRRDFRALREQDVQIFLLEGSDRLLRAFPPSLSHHAKVRLERLGVHVRLNTLVEAVRDADVHLRGGETLTARTLVWAAGVRPRLPAHAEACPTTSSGRIAVEPDLRVRGYPEVYAIGDVAGCTVGGQELPMLSAPAMQEGRHVARNILRALRGQETIPFRYRDKGIMATIGRHAGVAKLGPLAFRGIVGWIAWLVVHLYFIIGFRNRLVILLQWAWNYIWYDRPIRFVVRAADRENT